MKAYEKEIKRYLALNPLAEDRGVVILGGEEDKEIPVCELKQSFALDVPVYNRSAPGLTVAAAAEFYDACAAALPAESILLHIGAADVGRFEKEPSDFDHDYRALIRHIRGRDKRCRILVISLKNPENNPIISEMNQHLQYLAESERCQFGNITEKRVWNPQETRDVIAFVRTMGFVHPVKTARSDQDLLKILFHYDCESREPAARKTETRNLKGGSMVLPNPAAV